MEPSTNIIITKYKNGEYTETPDEIASEKRLRIFANNNEVLSLLCTPTMVKELITGFALSEGFLDSSGNNLRQNWCAESIEIIWKEKDIEVYLPVDIPHAAETLTSGCAKGITFSLNKELPVIRDNVSVSIENIFGRYKEFQKKSELFNKTGGVHSAALCDEKDIIVFAEDIGRHNAVDKIIGYAYLENISTKDKMLLLSGRLSSEIVNKGVRNGIPILISRSAPTDMAIEAARNHNVTLIGFLRGQNLNIYSARDRIK
ncbi:MAG: formate dehydrogenase accessory sulfurtransferase FdhD [Nitrospirae bacterium]|nr:formate dehydrogenase accessory sulfurtransferase FdhD [Nitrospirota bacterium]